VPIAGDGGQKGFTRSLAEKDPGQAIHVSSQSIQDEQARRSQKGLSGTLHEIAHNCRGQKERLYLCGAIL
jgi:hypothetical protein